MYRILNGILCLDSGTNHRSVIAVALLLIGTGGVFKVLTPSTEERVSINTKSLAKRKRLFEAPDITHQTDLSHISDSPHNFCCSIPVFPESVINMRFLSIATFFIALAGAAEVEVEWMHEKSTGGTMLSVFSAKDHTLLAKTCGSYLDSKTPIDLSNVDEDGTGNFTIGTKQYLVHMESSYSGGPKCTRKYSKGHSVIDCEGIEWNDKTEDVKATATSCPKNEHHFMRRDRGSSSKSNGVTRRHTFSREHGPRCPRRCSAKVC